MSTKSSASDSEPGLDFERIKAWLRENLVIGTEYPISGETPRITLSFEGDEKPFSSIVLPDG